MHTDNPANASGCSGWLVNMNDGTKVGLDVAAGTGTAAAWLGHAPDVVAVFTGVYILVRLWETETVKRLTRRD